MESKSNRADQTRTAVLEVARRISAAGGRALLVGGCVRDSLLGREADVKDFDFEVYGIPMEKLLATLETKFKLDIVGLSFGVIKLHHFDIDIALPRRETKLGLGHKAFETAHDPFLSIAEAAARRDFTINAIYRDPLTGEVIDPWGGQRDLEQRILRHISPHFSEDPLRVLRAMQFIARFGLTPAPETIAICKTMTPENLPRERLFDEWAKLLTKGTAISAGLSFLRATGWVRHYPELASLIGCQQDPAWHPEGDVWDHTCHCLDAFAAARDKNSSNAYEDLIVGLAVLCHDFGKPATSHYDPAAKHIRSRGHDEAGVEPTRNFLSRLTSEVRLMREVPALVRHHMRPYALWKGKSGDSAIRRLAADVVRIDRLLRVAAADDGGRPPLPPDPIPLDWLAAQAERLRIKDAAPKPIIQGRDLIAAGLKPGVCFGSIIRKCYAAQLDGAFTEREGAITFLHRTIGCLQPQMQRPAAVPHTP